MLDPFCTMEILALVIDIIILVSVLASWKNAQKSTKFFALTLVFAVLSTLVDVLSYIPTLSLEVATTLVYIALILADAMTPIFAYYAYYQVNSKKKVLPIWFARITAIVNALTIVEVTIVFFRGDLFTTPDGQLGASNSVNALYLVELTTSLFLAIVLIVYAKKMERRTFLGLISLMVIPLVAAVIEIANPGFYISMPSLAVNAVIQYIVIQSRLISESEMRERIENETARTDVMTGLLNRRAYTELIDSLDDTVDAGVAFFDINALKKTNDENGHYAGDMLIKSFANILKDNILNGDVYRISGDEFVAIYIGNEKNTAFILEMKDVQTSIQKHESIASMGSCFESGMNIEQAVSKAERLMYENKREYYSQTGNDRRRRDEI